MKPHKLPDTPFSEKKLREYIAVNLDLIEDGLSIMQQEFELPNDYGASGLIDIFCRDSFGNYVIIEIKKNDKTARQAVHELFKYASLLRSNYNIAPENIRCILISTHWHELLTPFSEFVRTSDYHTEGYIATITTHSQLSIKLSKVTTLPQSSVAEPCPIHVVYLYSEEKRRNNSSDALISSLKEAGIENACVLLMNYQGENDMVIYPYAHYLVIDSFDEGAKHRLLLAQPEAIDYLEENEWYFEERALSNIRFGGWDSIEIGYPEKFSVISHEWSTSSIIRKGRLLRANGIISDEQLIETTKGYDGVNSVNYYKLTCPKFANAWKQVLVKMERCLEGNESWKLSIYWFLDSIARSDPDAKISIAIYNPLDILTSLFMFTKTGDPNYLPVVEIVVDHGIDKTTILHGYLAWDGRSQPINIDSMLKDIFGDPFSMFLYKTTGEIWTYDNEIVNNMGLNYKIERITLLDNGDHSFHEIISYGDEVRAITIQDPNDISLLEYLNTFPWIIRQILELFEKNVFISNFPHEG